MFKWKYCVVKNNIICYLENLIIYKKLFINSSKNKQKKNKNKLTKHKSICLWWLWGFISIEFIDEVCKVLKV